MGVFDDYSGLVTAYPYAFAASDSWVFRAYVVASALTAAFVTVIFVSALVDLIAATASVQGGSLTLSRTFYVVLNLLVVLPVVAPVLFVARRHRRGWDVSPHYDRALAASGFLYVLAAFVGAASTTPPEHQTSTGALAQAIYDLHPAVGGALALAAALLVYVAHRRFA